MVIERASEAVLRSLVRILTRMDLQTRKSVTMLIKKASWTPRSKPRKLARESRMGGKVRVMLAERIKTEKRIEKDRERRPRFH